MKYNMEIRHMNCIKDRIINMKSLRPYNRENNIRYVEKRRLSSLATLLRFLRGCIFLPQLSIEGILLYSYCDELWRIGGELTEFSKARRFAY